MKIYRQFRMAVIALGLVSSASAQTTGEPPTATIQHPQDSVPREAVAMEKTVVITGARFSYPLVQQWIDDYSRENPGVKLIIESRGISDPGSYDILVEAYPPDEALSASREFIDVARYAILPVANSRSQFAALYGEKGLDKELISQVFFHDIFADREKAEAIGAPFKVYTRLQKAGSPMVFATHFGYTQKDIKGNAIAGSDEHLFNALLRDTTGITYLPLGLIYDRSSQKPIDGITVLPVDLNGNGRVQDAEKFYATLPAVIAQLEATATKDIHNIPTAYLHLSVDRKTKNPSAVDFLRWVVEHGQGYLHDFGYLSPEPHRFDPERFRLFASQRTSTR